MRFKDHGLAAESAADGLTLRSVFSGNIEDFTRWFPRRFEGDFFSTLSEREQRRLQERELKVGYCFIAEQRGKRFAEVTIAKDSQIRVQGPQEPPFYSVTFVCHDQELRGLGGPVIRLSVELASRITKTGTLIVLLDNEAMLGDYLENGFAKLSPDLVSSSIDAFYERRGIANPYKLPFVLVRTL